MRLRCGACGVCVGGGSGGRVGGGLGDAAAHTAYSSDARPLSPLGLTIPCHAVLIPAQPQYLVKNGGVDSEEDYAYWGMGLMCQRRKEADRHVVAIDGYEASAGGGAALGALR